MDMKNRKASESSCLGGHDMVNGGRSVMSAASVSAFVLFGERNLSQTVGERLPIWSHDLVGGSGLRGTALGWNYPLHGYGMQ